MRDAQIFRTELDEGKYDAKHVKKVENKTDRICCIFNDALHIVFALVVEYSHMLKSFINSKVCEPLNI